jgi:putative phosphoesterase
MEPFLIGVIADTHIPDRASGLPGQLLEELKTRKVQLILHAGDISVKRVLEELETIAPVYAVRGNRDFFLRCVVPMIKQFEINGVKIVLTHGHLNFYTYWVDKIQHVMVGYRLNRYLKRLLKAAPEAQVYVFGHSHQPENFWQDGKLFFNPGSVSFGETPGCQSSWGILCVYEDGRVTGEIIPLDKNGI